MKESHLTPELKKTIPWRLVLIFLGFSIAIILGGILFYQSQRDRIYIENQNALTAISILKIEQIEQWRKERLGDAGIIQSNGPLISHIRQYFENKNQVKLRSELLKWMESVYNGYDYSGISILDTNSNTILTISGYDSVRTGGLRNEMFQVLEKDTILMTDLHKTSKTGRSGKIHMDLLIPLKEFDKPFSKPFGILILRIDPDKILFPLIKSWPAPSESSETLILRKEGDSILYLNELRHKNNTALNLKLPLNNKKLLGSMVAGGHRGVAEGIDYRDIMVIGYLADIPDFNWFMVAKVDKDEILLPLKRYLFIAVLVTLLLVLINASIFGFFIWNQRLKYYRMRLADDMAIRESEEKFNTAFRMSPVSITLSRMSDYKFIDVTDTFLYDMEYSREEVLGRTARELNIWADEGERLWVMEELKEKGKIFGKVLSFRSKTGKIIYGLSSMSVVKVNGEPCNLSTVVNITEGRKAEQTLIESERKLREAQEMAHLGFWNWDINSGNVEWSEEVYKIFSQNPNDFTPQINSILELSPWPVDQQRDKELITRAIENHSPGSYEQRFLRPDKSIGYYHSTFQGRYDENGGLISVVGTVHDITDSKRAQELVQKSEEQYRLLFESINDAVMISELNEDGKVGNFIQVNEAACKSLGYSHEELLMMTPLQINSDKSKQSITPKIKNIIDKKYSIVEAEHVAKDGRLIPVEISTKVTQVNDKIFFLSIARDITERKSTEAEIKLQSEILSHMAEAVYLVRMKDGIIVFANSKFESIFGYENGEMLGKHVSIVNEPTEKSPEETAREIMNRLEEKGVWNGEVRNIKKDGTPFWTEANVTIFDHSQYGEVLISVQNDITDRKNAETQIRKLNEDLELRVIQRTGQLEAVNKELEAFSYSVSHDLRAPLRSVHGYTKILLEEYENKLDDEGKRICKIISTSATQMGGLIDDLLSFSRIGRSNLNPASINMKKMARLLFEGMTSPGERERIQLTIGKLQNSYGDVPLIGQVWVNLLSNAIKYSSKKEVSEISIGSHVNGESVTYFVKDNGVGFNMEYAHKLFGVFQRLHSEREFEGNGVGLAIVQRIILKHGGKVWAEGEIGKGATFYFSLPAEERTK